MSSATADATGIRSRPTPARGFKRFHHDHVTAIRGVTTIVVLLLAWEFVARVFMKGSIAVAAPTEIISEYGKLARSGDLWRDISASGQEFIYGFLAAVVVGIAIGLAMGSSKVVRDYLDPVINAFYATPVIALGPLFILWLGIGLSSKVAVVFILAVLPIIINTDTGIRNVDPHILETANAFSATRRQIFLKVMLPAALPFVISGIRLGVGRGLIGVVAGELFASQAGMGYLVLSSSQVFNPAGVFVGITALAITGIVSMILLKRLERKLAPWRTGDA
ncbi:ABC transporter permease [Solirubrobacter ginsenosidimutans]|uniref:ABC transporter permease n=1 Tax=Solirubrobacter ginsenosidimutans TaxID=490573 RepID=A0A9X3RYJ6_9ACTN|nr:ABC transporter permease [Solirubrobacter ginsenosidimutans]MDA0159239.1 ABC transporter permease [Solirubrobacter ginsenosidimutans]